VRWTLSQRSALSRLVKLTTFPRDLPAGYFVIGAVIADVAHGNVSIVFNGLTIIFAVDIGKKRRRKASSIDFSHRSRGNFIAVVI
jgi:hypothetical protein